MLGAICCYNMTLQIHLLSIFWTLPTNISQHNNALFFKKTTQRKLGTNLENVLKGYENI